MKRFAIIVAAILLAQTLSAQIITSRSHSIIRESTTGKFALQKGYRGFAEGALMINPGIDRRLGFNVSTIHGYQFNRWLYLGVGAGFEGADMPHNGKMATAVPVFADFRCYFTRTRLKPFVEVQLGYKISCGLVEGHDWGWYSDRITVYDYGGKFHSSVGVGVEYKWFSLKLSYNPWLYVHTDYYRLATGEQNISEGGWITGSVNIGLGFNF